MCQLAKSSVHFHQSHFKITKNNRQELSTLLVLCEYEEGFFSEHSYALHFSMFESNLYNFWLKVITVVHPINVSHNTIRAFLKLWMETCRQVSSVQEKTKKTPAWSFEEYQLKIYFCCHSYQTPWTDYIDMSYSLLIKIWYIICKTK